MRHKLVLPHFFRKRHVATEQQTREHDMPRMAPGTTAATVSATASAADDAADAPPSKRARVNSGKPRCPARPYRRVETSVMQARIADYKSKMEVLISKTTLLRQRLDMHNLEMEMRAADTTTEEAEAPCTNAGA